MPQTLEYHRVHKYTGLTFRQIDSLKLSEFLQYLRDDFILRLSQTEKGQEYLENAWILEQIEPDRENLRKRYGRKEDE